MSGKHTDISFALGQLRHLYSQMVSGYVHDTVSAAHGLLGPAIAMVEDALSNELIDERVNLAKHVAPLTPDEEAELRDKLKKGKLAWAHAALFASLDEARANADKKSSRLA